MPPPAPAPHSLFTARNIGVVVVVIALVLFAGYYYMNYYLPSRDDSARIIFNKEFVDLKSSYFSEDYSASIEKTIELIKRAPSKEDEGYLKIFLAAAYIHRDQQDDTAQGIKTYKEVVNDEQIPPRVRARALTDIAAIVLNRDLSFYQLYFPEGPFNAYIPSSGDAYVKLRTVYLKILQLSDQTYPTSQAEYAIAGNYYAPLVANGYISDKEAVADAAKQMRHYVSEGDAQGDSSLYSARMLATSMLYRAVALGYSANLLKDKPGLTYAEKAYESALAIENLPGAASDQAVRKQILVDRFWYASFLLNNFGAARTSDIQTILKPFSQAPAEQRLFADTSYNKQQLSKLAALSPALKQYLIAAGYLTNT